MITIIFVCAIFLYIITMTIIMTLSRKTLKLPFSSKKYHYEVLHINHNITDINKLKHTKKHIVKKVLETNFVFYNLNEVEWEFLADDIDDAIKLIKEDYFVTKQTGKPIINIYYTW